MLKFLRRRHRSESASLEPGARRRIDLGDEEPSYIIYAIGDIHGCVDLLLRAEEQIYDDAARSGVPALTILLGDYIDRGPSSRDVLEHLCKPLSGKRQNVSPFAETTTISLPGSSKNRKQTAIGSTWAADRPSRPMD